MVGCLKQLKNILVFVMGHIQFEFINKEIQLVHPRVTYNGTENPLRATLDFKIGYIGRLNKETDEEAIERVWKKINVPNCHLLTKRWTDLSPEELRKCLVVVEHPQPTSYPKFSNEKKFETWGNVNPEILGIRWDGIKQTWEYRLRNVGHVYDYQEERFLKEIEE